MLETLARYGAQIQVMPGDKNKHHRHHFKVWKKRDVFINVYEPADDWYWVAVTIARYNKERTEIYEYEYTHVSTRTEAVKWIIEHKYMFR